LDGTRGIDLTADFHTYAVDWQPGSLKWLVDGKRHAADDDQGAQPGRPTGCFDAIPGRDGGRLCEGAKKKKREKLLDAEVEDDGDESKEDDSEEDGT